MRLSAVTRTVVVLLFSLLLSACSSDDPAEESAGTGDSQSNDAAEVVNPKSNPLLGFVPADTAVFFGNGAPVSRSRFLPLLKQSNVYGDIDVEAMTGRTTAPESDGGKVLFALHKRYMSELQKPDTFGEDFGIGETWNAAVYTVSGAPVMRIALDDEARFDTTLASLEMESGATPVTSELGEMRVRRYLLEKKVDSSAQIDLVIASGDGYAVFTVFPSTLDEMHLKANLGVSAPARSLKDANTLKNIASDNDFLPIMIGYLNHAAIVDMVTSSEPVAFFEALKALSERDESPTNPLQTPECRAELADVASRWPRTVVGYTKWDVESNPMQMNGLSVVETSNTEFLEQLKSIEGVIGMPQAIKDARPAFSWSLGINVDKIMPFLAWFGASMNEKSYSCEPLAKIAEVSSNGFAVGMVAGMIPGVKGINVTALDVAFSEVDSSPSRIDSADAIVSVTTANPMALVNMAQSYLPMLAGLKVPEDGSPVAINVPIPGYESIKPMLSVKDGLLAIHVGDAAGALVSKLDGANAPGFIAFNMDYKKYFGIMLNGMQHAQQSVAPDSEQEKMMEAMRDIDATVDFRFDVGKRGFEIGSDMSMSHKK